MALGNSAEAAAAEREAIFQALVKVSVERHIQPRLNDLMVSTRNLTGAIGSACRTQSVQTWRKAKSKFDTAVLKWAAVSHLRFGPIKLKSRGRRMSFYPDPRGIVWRQLRRVLAKKDPTLLLSGELAKQSVALQGLTTLEVLLAKAFAVGDGPSSAFEAIEKYRCEFSIAVAKNINRTANKIFSNWTAAGGWRDKLYSPGERNSAYKNHNDAYSELVASAMLGFQVIRDQQVGLLLTALKRNSRVSRMPFFRSQLSAQYLRASIDGACEFVGLLDPTQFVPKDKAWIKGWIPKACGVLKRKSNSLVIPTSPTRFPGKLTAFDIRQLRFHANGVRQLIGREIVPVAGLKIGFNELDGD